MKIEDHSQLWCDVQYAIRQLRQFKSIERALDALDRIDERMKTIGEDEGFGEQYRNYAVAFLMGGVNVGMPDQKQASQARPDTTDKDFGN
jgi:hypothetical protein